VVVRRQVILVRRILVRLLANKKSQPIAGWLDGSLYFVFAGEEIGSKVLAQNYLMN